MFTRLMVILAICVINSTLCYAHAPKPSPKESSPQQLPWPQKGVTFPNNGLLNIHIGDPTAPVVIHEISAVTCFHCAGFHRDVFPKLKKKYIDTGKARLVIHHCPIDGVSLRVAMLLTQIPSKDRYGVIKKLWATQPKWFPDDFSVKSLTKMSQHIAQYYPALPAPTALTYLQDEKLAEAVVKDRLELDKYIQIDGTPTFIINGDVVLVASTFENMDKLITAQLDTRPLGKETPQAKGKAENGRK